MDIVMMTIFVVTTMFVLTTTTRYTKLTAFFSESLIFILID